MTIEHRAIRGAQIRAVAEGGEHFIDLQIITPNVVDDYGSVWMEDLLRPQPDERMPTPGVGARLVRADPGGACRGPVSPARARWCGSGSTTSMRCRRRAGVRPGAVGHDR